MHWQPLLLPAFSAGTKAPKGFRANEKGYWQRDRREVLVDELPLEWLASENWESHELSPRGRLREDLCREKVLVIGAGALGSVFAELLLRGGVRNLVIVDSDIMHGGNLVRHTLVMDDVGAPKAEALARRLNASSPQASVLGLNTTFPPENPQHLAEVLKCGLIVDCTGSDQVLHEMEILDWGTPKLFLSISLGPGAARLYCCAAYGTLFPHDALRGPMTRWLREDMESFGYELPREGTGCWHPVFPARADEIWGMASMAVRHLVGILASPPAKPQLAVYEQRSGSDGPGLVRIALEDA